MADLNLIDTIVFLMMENRSFDHMLGHLSLTGRMPGVDGVTAIEMIREKRPSANILVLTTYDSDADILRAIEAGATGYLLKDTPREELYRAIRAAAKVTYDETRLTDVTLKFDAWIGELYANYMGAPVSKGGPLFSVYSPDLVSAQQEYLDTWRRRRDAGDTLVRAARQRLSLWDIDDAQIRALEKRGTAQRYLPIVSPISGTVIEKHVVAGTAMKAGTRLLRLVDLSRVWIEGQVYEYELPLVKPGMQAEVVLPEIPGQPFKTTLTYVDPYLDPNTRTARVRVELPNPNGLLRPDTYAHIHLNVELGERLVVPESAVLYAGHSRVVFVDLGEGRLQPRKIKTGERNGDWIEVLEGVAEGETVVTSGNFLIAAESKLKSGINQW